MLESRDTKIRDAESAAQRHDRLSAICPALAPIRHNSLISRLHKADRDGGGVLPGFRSRSARRGDRLRSFAGINLARAAWGIAIVTRRRTVLAMLALGVLPRLSGPAAAQPDPEAQLAELERKSGGRLGVVAFDTATGKRFAHRPDDRFPLCSTFKLLAAAAVLSRVDQGLDQPRPARGVHRQFWSTARR